MGGAAKIRDRTSSASLFQRPCLFLFSRFNNMPKNRSPRRPSSLTQHGFKQGYSLQYEIKAFYFFRGIGLNYFLVTLA